MKKSQILDLERLVGRLNVTIIRAARSVENTLKSFSEWVAQSC